MPYHAESLLPAIQLVAQQLRQDYLYFLYREITPMFTGREDVNRQYLYSFPEGTCAAFYLWCNPIRESDPGSPDWALDAQRQVEKALEDIDGDFETLVDGSRVFGICGFAGTDTNPVTQIFSDLLRRHSQSAGRECTWTIGLGQYMSDLAEISHSVVVAQHALKQTAVHGPNRLYDGNAPETVFTGGLILMPNALQLELVQAIQNLKKDKIEASIQEAFDEGRDMTQKYPAYAYMLTLHILKISMQTLRELMPIDRETYEMSLHFEEQVDNFASVSALNAHAKHAVLALCEKYQEFQETGITSTVWKICTYIREHYMEDITLSELGYQVDRNPYYLSARFSSEMGVTISAFVTSLRMQKARELLSTTDMTVAQVGQKVGFSDSKYFSRVFCKQTGQSPGAYRKAVQAAN